MNLSMFSVKNVAKVLAFGLISTSVFGITGCEEEIDSSNFAIKSEQTLADIIDSNPELSLARDLFKRVRLGNKANSSSVYSVISARGNYTVFVPDNVAVEAYLKTLGLTSIDELTNEQAELVVTETQSVLTAVIGGVTHVMTYKGSLRLEADLPAAPVEFAASHAYAYYTEGLFKLYLSDLGLDADGNEKANGTYYEFNVNVDKFAPEAKIAIPAGTYDIKSINPAPGTISGGDYYKLDAEANDVVDSDMIWDGYLTIGENGSVKGECTMFMSGATHTVTYSGEIAILESFMPTEPPYSTLKTDKVCDFSNHDIMGMDMGDAHNTGYQTWSISLSGNDSKGDHVVFELLAGEVGKSEIYGKYTVGDSKGSYTAMPGYVDGFTLMSSWYYYKKNTANVTEYAPIVSGWVEISKGEDGKITVAFDVYDDLKNHITGSWTSESPLMKSGESYSKVVL